MDRPSPTGTHIPAQGETLGTGQTPNHPGSLKGSNAPPAAFRCSSPAGSRASGGAYVAPGDPRRAVMLLAFGEHRIVRFVRAVHTSHISPLTSHIPHPTSRITNRHSPTFLPKKVLGFRSL